MADASQSERDDLFCEALFEPIKTILRTHPDGMYEEDLIDALLPVIDARYTVADCSEAIRRLTLGKILFCQPSAIGMFVTFV
jgi:hypothetical protein